MTGRTAGGTAVGRGEPGMQLVFQSQFSGRDACGRQREEHSMGFLDKLKNKSGGIKAMASDAVDKHGDKIGDGLAKTKDLVDDKTRGKRWEEQRVGKEGDSQWWTRGGAEPK